MRFAVLALYVATVPLANWMVGNVGACDHGPCVVPVGFGLYAPSGVLVIGAALVLRDWLQELMGVRWTLAAICLGVLASALLAPPALVIASALAFAIAETLDLLVYTPLRRQNMVFAVIASGVVGALADSAVFLWVAFGSLEYVGGNVVGKVWATLFGVSLIVAARAFRSEKAT